MTLLWDPEGDGESLSGDEILRNAAAIRAHRIANIVAGLGRPEALRQGTEPLGQTIRISIEPSEDALPPEPSSGEVLQQGARDPERRVLRPLEQAPMEAHEDVYVAALISRLGVRPILNTGDLEAAQIAQGRAQDGIEPSMIYGFSTNALMSGEHRKDPWISAGGIVSIDGAGLFNLKDIEIGEV